MEYYGTSMAHGAHAAAFEHSSAQPGQPCAYECGRNGGWADCGASWDSQSSGMMAGMDCVDDMLDLELLSDEELLEGLFGRVETVAAPISNQSYQVEDQFARLRLKQ